MLEDALRGIEERAGRRAVVWGVALAVLGVVLCGVPLFDLLGYDFSFALGLATAFGAADVGHGTVTAARRAGRPITLLPLVARAVVAALALLPVPLLFSVINGLRVKNCNLPSGLAFFALLPVGTAIYAGVGGALAGLVFPRRGRLVALLLPVLSLLWSLVRLYRDPAVFAFDPFGGYFPGPIYDEALRPPLRLLYYRLCNLVWAGAAVAVASVASSGGRPGPGGPPQLAWRPALWSTPSIVAASVLAVAGLSLFVLRGTLGFHLRHRDLQAALSRRTESKHFVLFTDPAGGQTAEDIDLVHRDLEFRYHQLVRILGTEPHGRITVYQFPSAAVKKDLVGAGNTLYAKPWTREVFVQADRFPASRLRHELAHVFAASFGDNFFGVSFSWRWWGPLPRPQLASGLIEGIAEAADFGDPDGRSTIHQEARAIVAAGRAPALRSVVGAGFSTLAGARAYTLAGSFCHFLLLEHGAERLRALYRSAGDFQGVYGQSIDELERQWRAFLDRQPLEPAERARAQERFRRPAIFSKVCARELAARVAEARGRMYVTPDRAVALLESACQDDPQEPSFRLDLAEALAAAGHTDQALRMETQAANDEALTWPLRARAWNLAATLHFHAGRFAEAEAAVRHALALATDEGEERTGLAKLRALGDLTARATLGRVLFGDSITRGVDPAVTLFLVDRFARAFPAERLGPYLMSRQLAWRDPRLALPLAARACGPDVTSAPLSAAFQRECLRMTADAAFRAGDLGASRSAIERLAAEADNEAERLRAADFLERIGWEQAGRP
jgi:tetratricopeptide (TPR) repeat protein